MTLKLDQDNPLSTKVHTRDGRKARIIATDAKGEYPIVALVECGEWEASCSYHADGRMYRRECQLDLINVPERRTVERRVSFYSTDLLQIDRTDPNVRFTFEGDKMVAAEVIG